MRVLILSMLAVFGAACGAPPGDFHFSANGYEIAPGTEDYRCFVFNHPTGGNDAETVGIKRLTVKPGGAHVHHVVVFTDSLAERNGNRTCDAMEAGWNWRYAAGVGTNALELPAGVAIPVKASETFIIQFHYLNADVAPIFDETTIDIEFTKPGEQFVAADLFVTGSTDITVPANTAQTVVEGRCLVPADAEPMSAVAWFPHMHTLGRRLQVEVVRGDETLLMHDAEFDFDDQPMFYPAEPFQLLPGDEIVTRCIFENATPNEVKFGETSAEEMCFNFMTVFPAMTAGQSFNCF